MSPGFRAERAPLLIAAALALAAGIAAGLGRLGWSVPIEREGFGLAHGPLMVSGFLGTLISLERAAALGGGVALGVPAVGALGGLVLLAGGEERIAASLALAASLGLVALSAAVMRRQATIATATSMLGAAAWAVGNALWLAALDFPDVVSWWIGFLVLTIAAERLELSRVLDLSPASRAAFVVVIAVLLAAIALGGVAGDGASRLLGASLLGLTIWLARHDIARRTFRRPGLTGFTATALLSGYVWLGAAALLLAGAGTLAGGPIYDAVLHAIFVGFVFAMIFGHAPIIFPAVIGAAVPFRTIAYVPLLLLHLSLALRWIGDVAAADDLRAWGAMGNAAAIALFLVLTLGSAIAARRA